MANQHNIRPSDSSLVHTVTQSVAASDGYDVIVPDGRWDLIFVKLPDGGQKALLVSKPFLRAVEGEHLGGQESVVITFNTGIFLATNSDLDRGFYELPVVNKNQFKLGHYKFEIPTFDNAEGLVEQLKTMNLLVQDDVVTSVVSGRRRAQSERTVQRHFQYVTGMTPNYYLQIQRALDAAALLRQGVSAIQVAHDLGYYDQFHLSKSLKQILGQTPSQIARS